MARSLPSQQETGAAYVSEAKIYARSVMGRYKRLQRASVIWLLGMYYLFPWLRWDDRQAVLFDLPARRFYVFGLSFWPQDFLFLALLLIIAALTLFFFTTLAGRLWCGFACPQTIWTEAFMMMERWAEGDRLQRMKLDAAPWSTNKVLRKVAKHTMWLVFALWTGFTFVGFFTPIVPLAGRAASLSLGGWEFFWIIFYAVATWGNAGFLREQVCKYMCPYARFQSAMFDRNTLIISYDPMRGEPRGPRRRGVADVISRGRGLLDKLTAFDYVFRASQHPSAANQAAQARGTITFDKAEAAPLPVFQPEELGDCIDCMACVHVCPTGIDIRNGLQYECIACGACVDACNEVMDKVGYPRGLIRFDTQNAIEGEKTSVVRPRILVYGVLLAGLLFAWGWGVTHRSTFIADILRDRNALYRVLPDTVENIYTLKLVNKTEATVEYTIGIVRGPDGARLDGLPASVSAAPAQVLSLPLVVSAPLTTHGRHELVFSITSVGQAGSTEVKSSFFAPDDTP